jgi:hypothetical protein
MNALVLQCGCRVQVAVLTDASDEGAHVIGRILQQCGEHRNWRAMVNRGALSGEASAFGENP